MAPAGERDPAYIGGVTSGIFRIIYNDGLADRMLMIAAIKREKLDKLFHKTHNIKYLVNDDSRDKIIYPKKNFVNKLNVVKKINDKCNKKYAR